MGYERHERPAAGPGARRPQLAARAGSSRRDVASRTPDPFLRLKYAAAALRVMRSLLAIYRLSAKANFDPGQPRIPPGQPGGGRWTDGTDDAVLLAQGPQGGGPAAGGFRIDLLDHENRNGSHTIARHVGKTDSYLLRRMETERVPGLFVSVYLSRAGTFSSLESANRLVSSTLARNPEIVNEVARGEIARALIKAEFRQPTGHEYYRDVRGGVRIFTSHPIRRRITYGVGVSIRHDTTMPHGFLIVTAYPREPD